MEEGRCGGEEVGRWGGVEVGRWGCVEREEEVEVDNKNQ